MQDVLSKPQPALQDQPALFEDIEAPSKRTDSAIEPVRALPFRNDTMLGVCEALGQDFGFNANYLRIVLAAMVVWNLEVAFGVYFGLGVVVAVSRWLAPAKRQSAAPQQAADRDTRSDHANANTEALSAAA